MTRALTTQKLSHKTSEHKDGNQWLSDLRQQASLFFENQGFPTKRHEAWKYTSLHSLPEKAIASWNETVSHRACMEPLEGSYIIVLQDGKFDLNQSRLPEGLSVIDLNHQEISDESAETFYKLFKPEDITDDANSHVALNIANASEALSIRVQKGRHINEVIEVHHIITENKSGGRYTQLWLLQEADSHVTLLERFYGSGSRNTENDNDILQNHVSYFCLEKGAHLSHNRIQNAPINCHHLYTERVTLKDSSNYESFTLTTGAQLSRQETSVDIEGEHVHCNQKGITLGHNNQHHDAYLPVVHHSPQSYSKQHFRQILDDQSKGVFYGRVQVPETGQKTEAHQLNHNLLLSKDARAFTRPELDIFTDDVICSHGATVGDLDEQSIYYLQARGIDKEQAKRLLINAFAEEIINDLPHQAIRYLMQEHLRESIGGGIN